MIVYVLDDDVISARGHTFNHCFPRLPPPMPRGAGCPGCALLVGGEPHEVAPIARAFVGSGDSVGFITYVSTDTVRAKAAQVQAAVEGLAAEIDQRRAQKKTDPPWFDSWVKWRAEWEAFHAQIRDGWTWFLQAKSMLDQVESWADTLKAWRPRIAEYLGHEPATPHPGELASRGGPSVSGWTIVGAIAVAGLVWLLMRRG